MSAINNLDETKAQALIQKKGFTPTKVVTLNQRIHGTGTVTCYVVHVRENDNGFIIRGDTGEIYDSQEFWKEFGSQVLSGPWIEFHWGE